MGRFSIAFERLSHGLFQRVGVIECVSPRIRQLAFNLRKQLVAFGSIQANEQCLGRDSEHLWRTVLTQFAEFDRRFRSASIYPTPRPGSSRSSRLRRSASQDARPNPPIPALQPAKSVEIASNSREGFPRLRWPDVREPSVAGIRHLRPAQRERPDSTVCQARDPPW